MPVLPTPIAPIASDAEIRPLAVLLETVARIDGWGPRAWREVIGAWRLPRCDLAIEEREGPPCEEGGEVLATIVFRSPGWARPRNPGDAIAIADWLLRAARRDLLPLFGLSARTIDPGEAVRAGNACFAYGPDLVLRFALRLPFAGMCIDGESFARSIGQLARWSRGIAKTRPGLLGHRRSLRIQQALRAALPEHGLVAFLADGAMLARDPAGGVDASCLPLRTPRNLATSIDLGPLGRYRGLGIRRGVTAIAGAPYHGKSTVLSAIAAGGEDHPPGDGRERVVALASTLPVLSDDGRPIMRQDLTPFFSRLPGGEAACFTTRRASGATSMAAAIAMVSHGPQSASKSAIAAPANPASAPAIASGTARPAWYMPNWAMARRQPPSPSRNPATIGPHMPPQWTMIHTVPGPSSWRYRGVASAMPAGSEAQPPVHCRLSVCKRGVACPPSW